MSPTLCPHCGGHVDRCRCADIRREAFESAAVECDDLAGEIWNAYAPQAHEACEVAAARIRALAHPKGAA